MASLCFDSALAAFRKGHISEQQYLRHCLAHFAGERHFADRFPSPPALPDRNSHPVGEAIRHAALHGLYIPLQGKSEVAREGKTSPSAGFLARPFTVPPILPGTQLLERLFELVARHDLAALTAALGELRAKRPSFRAVIQPLAVYAASKHDPDALRFCLAHGASLEDDHVHAALASAPGGLASGDLYEALWRDLPTHERALYGLALRASRVGLEIGERARCRM